MSKDLGHWLNNRHGVTPVITNVWSASPTDSVGVFRDPDCTYEPTYQQMWMWRSRGVRLLGTQASVFFDGSFFVEPCTKFTAYIEWSPQCGCQRKALNEQWHNYRSDKHPHTYISNVSDIGKGRIKIIDFKSFQSNLYLPETNTVKFKRQIRQDARKRKVDFGYSGTKVARLSVEPTMNSARK